ncbi:MAG: PIG-L family deacetylase, partial [Chloroflexi bacterium]|nr:PIG-L family deacetylase [Chloroflexota bacterium]
DGELYPTLELRRDITRIIRLKKPEIVVTLDPTVYWRGAGGINHPDHRAIGDATLAAVFPTARARLNFLEPERAEGLVTHKVARVYIAGALEPTTSINVTDSVETQIESLRAHKSQIADMDKMAERIRERSLDPNAPAEYPRHIERFRVIHMR